MNKLEKIRYILLKIIEFFLKIIVGFTLLIVFFILMLIIKYNSENHYEFGLRHEVHKVSELYLGFDFGIVNYNMSSIKLNRIEVYETDIDNDLIWKIDNVEENQIKKKIFEEKIRENVREYRIDRKNLINVFNQYKDVRDKVFLVRIYYFDKEKEKMIKVDILITLLEYIQRGFDVWIPNI